MHSRVVEIMPSPSFSSAHLAAALALGLAFGPTLDSSATNLAAQTSGQSHGTQAALVGQVRSVGGEPVAVALIEIKGTERHAFTSSRGEFRVTGVPEGEWTVNIRATGYRSATFSLAFTTGEVRNLQLTLEPDPIRIEGIDVSARAAVPAELQEFYLRRDQGHGHFFTRLEIREASPGVVTDILRRVPGVAVANVSGPFGVSQEVRMGRSTGMSGRGACRVSYVVNGMPFPVAADIGINAFIQPQDIAGIEVYTGASRVPARFNSSSTSARCGVVVIWLYSGEPDG
ncbi:MAG: hypothetical protein EA350_15775 [Gemmatimonadales bacterium]|nr:MAG: hypothetical protein EA350_15775 [Gemmatimonadales bacterium]